MAKARRVMRRKNMLIDQRKLDAALDLVVFRAEVFRGLDAPGQPAELDRLKAFFSWALPSTVLSSVVVAELTAGARTPKAREALEQQFLAPFDRRGRIIAPSAVAWRRAAAVVGAAPSANRLSDVLLACQAPEFGWTIVTRDADFTTIRKSITGLKVAAPFPTRP